MFRWSAPFTARFSQPTPVTLVSHPVKKAVFDQAMDSAELFGRLVHLVAQDSDYIEAALRSVSDPFTARLKDLLHAVIAEGLHQPLSMGIHRSDYMIHQGDSLQQVEINTISSAFGALTHRMSDFHRHLIENWARVTDGKLNEDTLSKDVDTWQRELLEKAHLENPSLEKFVDLFNSALDAYCAQRGISRSAKVAVLMIVQPGERNSVDQRWLQYRMEQKHGIHVLRHSLRYVEERVASIESSSDYVLSLDGYEVAVAYYRAGYTPTDYPSESEWNARLKIERSRAIKCPSIAYHLVGTKKMQQYLALPGQVERFIKNEADARAIRNCFTGLYSLSNDDLPAQATEMTPSSKEEQASAVQKVISLALENPHRYVMKPQREGGGNLLTNEDMVHALKTMSSEERSDYILMERIEPETHSTILFRDSNFVNTACIAELGVYCLVLADVDGKEIVNQNGGWLLRSKPADVEDGGVAAGRAFLDSPYIF